MGSGGIAPRILNLGTKWMWVSGQLHAQAALPSGERTSGTNWIGGWLGPRAGLDTVAKTISSRPYRESNPGRPVRNLVTVLTELRQLQSHVISQYKCGTSVGWVDRCAAIFITHRCGLCGLYTSSVLTSFTAQITHYRVTLFLVAFR
jgi:hypothetical protein